MCYIGGERGEASASVAKQQGVATVEENHTRKHHTKANTNKVLIAHDVALNHYYAADNSIDLAQAEAALGAFTGFLQKDTVRAHNSARFLGWCYPDSTEVEVFGYIAEHAKDFQK
jgi:hypothetical protein